MKQEIKIIQHADDCTLPVKNTIDTFCKHSGMKLNKYKTECILLGTLKGTAKEILQIKVNENSVKSLGIYIGQNKIECQEKIG